MKPDIVFQHDGLILDACCVINLCVSEEMEAILRAVPTQVTIAAYVANEEVLRCSLQPFTDMGLLRVVDIETEEDAINVIEFVATLKGDGEAYTGAIALSHNWAIASDESKVLKFFARETPHLQRLTTPELVKHWADITVPTPAQLERVLKTIEVEGHYTISERNPCYLWWREARNLSADGS